MLVLPLLAGAGVILEIEFRMRTASSSVRPQMDLPDYGSQIRRLDL